jgi:hypothetical protein
MTQMPVMKKRLLELLGFGRRAPNGWMRIYDVPRHFRIVLLGPQVANRHHTEYDQIFTALAPNMGAIAAQTMEAMRDFPESAVLTNHISMDLIDEAYELIFEGYNNDATVVTMSWNANSEKYDFESHGRDSKELVGQADLTQRILPTSSSRFYHPPKMDKEELYKEEMEIFGKFETRRHAIFAHSFKELTKPYRDNDTPLVEEMKRLAGEKCLYMMKGFETGSYTDWNTKRIAKSIALWKRAPMSEMPFPSGTELCEVSDTLLSVVWDEYQLYCIRDFRKLVEIIKAECIPEERVLSSFSPAATEAFTKQFVVIIFQEEYYQLRCECVDYYRNNMDEIRRRNPNATWMLSIKEQVRQSFPPSYFTKTLKQTGKRWQQELDMMLLRKQHDDESLEERRIMWWHFQMNRLFGQRKENQIAMINLDEPDQDPEDYLTLPMIEDWFVERLLDPKYSPNQVLLFWQKCEFTLTQVSQTKLLQKILGQIDDMNSPRRFVKLYRLFSKLRNSRLPKWRKFIIKE